MMTSKVAISKFKSHRLEIIENLQADKHQVIIITKRDKPKRDKPIARVVPFDNKKTSLFGMLKNKAEIKGDIVSMIDEKWNAQV
jgi:antitoxin (DNA-binding transcriptional repressor) of toxin-antitoxin stability system